MTCSDFHAHNHPLFINLNLIKARDIISIEQLILQLFFTLRSNVKTTPMNLRDSTLNFLDIPKVTTTTYGVRRLRFFCSNHWNSVWKNGIFTRYNRKLFSKGTIEIIVLILNCFPLYFFFFLFLPHKP